MNETKIVAPPLLANILPSQLPVFPITGLLLLPGMYLPLHVFEMRYRNLVQHVLNTDGCMGVVQPLTPRNDNQVPLDQALDVNSDSAKENPPLQTVGCMGRLVRCEVFEDGRSAILLQGWRRFAIQSELPLQQGYRLVAPTHTGYENDVLDEDQTTELTPAQTIPHQPFKALTDTVQAVAHRTNLQVDIAQLHQVKPWQAVNGLCMRLPLHPVEKQALLEAPTLLARTEMLQSMLQLLQKASNYQTSTQLH